MPRLLTEKYKIERMICSEMCFEWSKDFKHCRWVKFQKKPCDNVIALAAKTRLETAREIDKNLQEMDLLKKHNHKKGEIHDISCPRCTYELWFKSRYLTEGK